MITDIQKCYLLDEIVLIFCNVGSKVFQTFQYFLSINKKIFKKDLLLILTLIYNWIEVSEILYSCSSVSGFKAKAVCWLKKF